MSLLEAILSGFRKEWAPALWHALPVAAVVLGLMAYWYAVANRVIVFLYDHDMGPLFPDTGPFGAVTRGRYWMAGLVVGGFVLVGYTATLFVIGRLARTYRPPAWRRVWLLCALPLAVGIPAITMTQNAPVLPPVDALAVTAATVAAVGLALTPGAPAARAPSRLAGLAVEGAGVAAVADSVAFAPRSTAFLAHNILAGTLPIAGALIAGLLLLLAVALVRRRRRVLPPPLWMSLVAGLCWAYLLGPLAHYLVGTDGWFYITTADNFFPGAWLPLLAGWLLAAALLFALRRMVRLPHDAGA